MAEYIELPLDPEFVTPDGAYMGGYIWGQHARSEKDARQMFPGSTQMHEDFYKGVQDGYNDWLTQVNERMAADKNEAPKPAKLTLEEMQETFKKMQNRVNQLEERLSPSGMPDPAMPTMSPPAGANPGKSSSKKATTSRIRTKDGMVVRKVYDDKGYHYEDAMYDTLPPEDAGTHVKTARDFLAKKGLLGRKPILEDAASDPDAGAYSYQELQDLSRKQYEDEIPF